VGDDRPVAGTSVIGLALRGMAQRKLRSALTVVAVLLGVAMVAGTFVQTDRIANAFDDIMGTVRGGTDVVVTARTTFTSDFMPTEALGEQTVARVRGVPGVARAEGSLDETGALVVDGETVDTGFAPTVVSSATPEPFSPLEYTDGRAPARPGEVAVDEQLADDQGLRVGRRVGLTTRTGVRDVTIAGVVRYEGGAPLGGSTLVVGRLEDLQAWYGREGEVTEVLVAAREGVSPEQLAGRVRAALPPQLEVETGAQNAEATSQEVNDTIGSFLTPALLALSGAALLVGGFIIFNTFSITVAQRTREFGLLRAMGATRGQLLGAVAVEALVIGAVASALGIAGGLGFAALLGSLFSAAGMGIPVSGLELAPRTIALSLGVGLGVTLAAAVVPARRATHVPPIAALAEAPVATQPGRRRRLAPLAAAGVGLLGVALLVQGLFGSGPAFTRLGALGGGAVLIFVAVALVAQHLVRPLASALGWPIERAFSEPGRLARDNAMRNPARTATTSAALMVGVGLVVFVAVFAAGLKSSIAGSVDDVVRADLIVTERSFQPLASGAADAIRGVEGVRAVAPQYLDQVQVNGEPVSATVDQLDGVDPAVLASVYEPSWRRGGSNALFGRLRGDAALVEEQFAERHGIAVGERFRVETSAGNTATLRAIGEYADPLILQGVIVETATFRRLSAVRDPFAFFVGTAPGADTAAVGARLERALGAFPTAEVRTKAAYRELIEGQLDTITYLLYALLAMSLVISLFGIVNSLFLSVHERVREFGLLRAIGATQGQVRRVVRYESVITSVIGGVLGTAIGIAFAALAIAALSDLGLRFALPAGQLLVFLVLSVAVGVAGAVVPARRAARVDLLDATRHT
jgi:putative ABC transport system permease protein